MRRRVRDSSPSLPHRIRMPSVDARITLNVTGSVMTSLRLTAVLLSLWASAAPLRAELMLDDFDDPALTTSPEMENVFVITPNVGGLNAERQIRIATAAANPVARFGADTITESNLVAQLSGVNPTDTGGALMAFQFNYDFAPTDVSQSGANDSILLDFRGRSTPPASCRSWGCWSGITRTAEKVISLRYRIFLPSRVRTRRVFRSHRSLSAAALLDCLTLRRCGGCILTSFSCIRPRTLSGPRKLSGFDLEAYPSRLRRRC